MTTTVTFMEDEENDGVMVLHDGVIAWQEQSWGYIDQYLAFYAPKDTPVILRYGSAAS